VMVSVTSTGDEIGRMLIMMEEKGGHAKAAKLAIDRLTTRFHGKYEELRATAPPR
jgi:hypothetical protein